jgi:hypothetical protein
MWLTAIGHAATSDILFAPVGGTFSGRAGNLVFNGQHFATPLVQTDGTINLTLLDTNAVIVSNISLSITGSTPRIALNGSGYLLAWVDTQTPASVLKCAAVSNGVLGPVFTGESNISEETLSLSPAADKVLAVFQSGNAVFAREINSDGSLTGAVFDVSPSAQVQVNPSVGTDGTNHLVCWMEQNVASNDWRVMVQRITAGVPNGPSVQVSETNSMRPYRTACSFGTNFLVAWSADEGPWTIPTNIYVWWGMSNLWRPAVYIRMLSGTAAPLGRPFSVLRSFHYNTNVAVAFGNGRYLVTCYNWGGIVQRVQPLAADGTFRQAWFDVFSSYFDWTNTQPHLAFGADRFCVIYSDGTHGTYAVAVGAQTKPSTRIINLRRTNDSIMADIYPSAIEVSTNFIDWEKRRSWELPSLGGRPQLFVRQVDPTWLCIENLRLIDWAKQRWAMDNFKRSSDPVTVSDLVGPTKYLLQMPSCPLTGGYSLGDLVGKPTCNVAGHSY